LFLIQNVEKQGGWAIISYFGLLNIIVLGEVLLSAALAIQAMQKSGHWSVELTFVAISATIVPFMLWWLYFNEDENDAFLCLP
jgi:low temperature requirement protein LtrA